MGQLVIQSASMEVDYQSPLQLSIPQNILWLEILVEDTKRFNLPLRPRDRTLNGLVLPPVRAEEYGKYLLRVTPPSRVAMSFL